jgi:hypothetical protein
MAGGDYDSIFGNLPRRFSYNPPDLRTRYGAMPRSRNIEDQRGQKIQPDMNFDQWVESSDYGGGTDPEDIRNPPYPPSPMGGHQASPWGQWPPFPISDDPLVNVGDLAWVHKPNPSTGPYGANPYYPSGPHPASQPPLQLPPGMSPGSPGWMTPPSPSGPHPQTYPQGQGPQPPIFSPQGWPQPPAGPLSQNALPYYLQNAGYGQ